MNETRTRENVSGEDDVLVGRADVGGEIAQRLGDDLGLAVGQNVHEQRASLRAQAD